jgi:hypothetical protein
VFRRVVEWRAVPPDLSFRRPFYRFMEKVLRRQRGYAYRRVENGLACSPQACQVGKKDEDAKVMVTQV